MVFKKKQSMTGVDLAAVIESLKKLIPLQVVNIYELGREGLLLKLRSLSRKEPTFFIAAEASRRLHITSFIKPRETMPPPLVMGFRKYLRGQRIVGINQLGADRVAFIEAANGYKLVVELLPRGVIALLNDKGSIVYTTRQLEMRDRVIKAGYPYKPPPMRSKHPNEISSDDLSSLVTSSGDLLRELNRALALPGEFIEEAIFRAGLEPNTRPSSLSSKDIDNIIEAIKLLWSEALEGKGYIVLDENETPVTVTPFKPTIAIEKYGYDVKLFNDINQALDEYFAKLEKSMEEEEKLKKLEEEKRRLARAIEMTRKQIEEYEQKARMLEEVMSILGENMASVYEAYERIASGEKPPIKIGPIRIVKVDPSSRKIAIEVLGHSIESTIDEDPARILVNLSKEAGELRAKAKRAKKAIEELKNKISSIEETIRLSALRARASLRRREWYEAYHWIVTSHGFLAIGGRNADQNESIVKKYLSDKDIFMHADIHGAPAVVMLTKGVEPPSEDLREAAVIAAAYSRAWREHVGAIDVYWVWGSQVSKSPPPGQYLAKGSFMVYGRRNYIRGVRIELAIGIGFEEDSPLIIVGPQELVKRRSAVYAVLAPGDEDADHVAKRLKKIFLKLIDRERSTLIDVVKIDEIRERIPGASRILSAERGEESEPPRGSESVRRIHREHNTQD